MNKEREKYLLFIPEVTWFQYRDHCLKVPRNHFKNLTYVETLFFCKLVNVRVFNIYHMHELSYLKVKRTSRLLESIRLYYRLRYSFYLGNVQNCCLTNS